MQFNLKLSFVLLLIGFYINPVKAQFKYHDNLEVRVTTQVQKDDENYVYEFIVENKNSSVQKLETIRIEIGDMGKNKGGTVSNITQIETLGNKWAGWTSDAKAKPRNKNAKGLVLWVANYDSIKNVSDIFTPPVSALEPGESQKLSMASEGLPIIMRYFARGWNEPYTQSEYDSLRYDVGYSADKVSPPWYEDAYQGYTIAPVLPSDTLTNHDVLNQLHSQLSFSCDTTWIANRGICRSLQAKLENVGKQLGKDKIKQAINGLNAFLNEVEAQRGKHITEEGYAVLYFNGQYLKEQLEEQSGGGKGNGKGRGNKGKNPNRNPDEDDPGIRYPHFRWHEN